MGVGWTIHFWFLNDMHFIWLDALAMLINNPTNIFKLSQTLFYIIFLSINISWYLKKKKFTDPLILFFFIMFIVKTLPKYQRLLLWVDIFL